MPNAKRRGNEIIESFEDESGDVEFVNPVADGDEEFSGKGNGVKGGVKGMAGSMKKMAPKKIGQVDTKKLQSLVSKSVFGAAAPQDGGQRPDIVDEFALKRKWFGLLHPRAPTRRLYDGVHIFILLYMAFTVPKRIAFSITPDPWEVTVDLMMDAAIVCDIFLNFKAYYYNNERYLVTKPLKIRLNYMRTWFFVDLFAVVPADQVVLMIGALMENAQVEEFSSKLRLIRLLRFFRLVRLPKVLDLRGLKMALSFIVKRVGITRGQIDFFVTLIFLLMVMIGTGHLMGCYWAATGYKEYEKSDGWMQYIYEGKVVDPAVVYIDSLYFALVTVSSVGYGDILAQTTSEKTVVIGIIMAGAFLYAFIIGNFSSMVENMTHDQSAFDTKMRGVGELMKFYGIPQDLHVEVLDFYNFKFSAGTLFDSNAIMNELPTSLRQNLVLHRFKDTIQMVPFLQGIRDDVTVELCQRMKEFPTMPGGQLMVQGTFSHELLILTRGVASTIMLETELQEHMAGSVLRAIMRMQDPEVFAQFDVDGDGTVDREELRNGLMAAGEILSDEDMDELMAVIDGDGDGIEQEELERTAQNLAKVARTDEEGMLHEVGSFFGELEFLGVSESRSMTLEAVTYCETATLLPEDISDVFVKHPFLRDRFERYGKMRQEIDRMVEEGADMDEIAAKLEESAREVQAINEEQAAATSETRKNLDDQHGTALDTPAAGKKLQEQLAANEAATTQLQEKVVALEENMTAQAAELQASVRQLGEMLRERFAAAEIEAATDLFSKKGKKGGKK